MEFVAQVGTSDGQIVEQVLDARSERAARDDLERQGLHVFKLKKRARWNEALSFSTSKIDGRDFLVFNQELASLLKAGLPLLQTLQMLQDRQRDGVFKSVLAEVRDRVKAGEELSSAFGSYEGLFPAIYPSTLMAGERSGELEEVIRRFIRYQELVLGVRKRVINALVYPALLFCLSIAMVAVMVVFVLPRFQGFYDALEVELPALTSGLLAMSDFIRSRGLITAAVLIVVVLACRQWFGSRFGREWLDMVRLKIPIAGPILKRFSASEFCRSLATLLAGGLPLVPALDVAVGSVTNRYLKRRLEPVTPAVREGKAFHQALDESGVVGDLAVDLVEVGESTGALDEMLTNVSDFYDEEIDTRIQRLLALLEPVMLVVMATVVAILLVAIYLPLFDVIGQMEN